MSRTHRPAPTARVRLVVLEDDQALREFLIASLGDYGFQAHGVGSAAALYRLLIEHSFDLALLDIGLPDEDGLSVVEHLRRVLPRMGAVMLTANQAREDQIEALTRGADAFVRKPVDIEVLALTLRNLARRLPAPLPASAPAPGAADAADAQAAPGWRLESDGWCLAAPDGRVLPLTVSERAIVRVLDAHRGAPVPREMLIAVLVEDAHDFDPHRLDMLVHRLRRKARAMVGPGAGSDAAGARAFPLHAVRGVGYRLDA